MALEKYKELTKHIPWASSGRPTVASQVGLSLVPVGILPYDAPPYDPSKPPIMADSQNPDFEQRLMNICGTAAQAGDGKFVTCGHVVEALHEAGGKGYILVRLRRENTIIFVSYPIVSALRYIDPRTEEVNRSVDLAVLIVPVTSSPHLPYETPSVKWGDSSKLGVGDPVVLGGFPYGTDMFRVTETNRGFIQPTFCSGIVSAIIPALKEQETRLIQISVGTAGGMSGGAVFDPKTGRVLGMVTSGLEGTKDTPHPVTYALPSEIIAPFVGSISYETKDGRRRGLKDIGKFKRLWRDTVKKQSAQPKGESRSPASLSNEERALIEMHVQSWARDWYEGRWGKRIVLGCLGIFLALAVMAVLFLL